MERTVGYHAGERAAQVKAGLQERAERVLRSVHATVPDVAAAFLAAQTTAVLGAARDDGTVWASLLTGPPGFISATESRVDIAARPPATDPLATVLERPAEVGTVMVDFARRRRMRVNGRSTPDARGVRVEVAQAYSNCPKYIQARSPHPAPDRVRPSSPWTGDRLGSAQQELIAAADTFFIATVSGSGEGDASHRGGNPGFVEVASPTSVRWPDYTGNAMMMTLGNIEENPAAGLLFPDWESGAVLQVTGTARVDWSAAGATSPAGVERMIEFEIRAVQWTEGAIPLSWSRPEYSPANPPVQ